MKGRTPLELPFDALTLGDVSRAYAYFGAFDPHELAGEEVNTLLSALQEIKVYFLDDVFIYENSGGGLSWHSPTFRIELTDGEALDIDWTRGELGAVLTLNGTYYRGDGATFAALERFYKDEMWPYFQSSD